MKILALEFSSAQRSVAVAESGAAPSGVAFETGGRHMRALALVESALRDAHWEREAIECLAVGLGPGSYTGIRAAISLAQGWALARAVKLLGVSSAACLAEQARAENIFGRVNTVIDAQRNEFYLAAWEITPDAVRVIEPLRLATLDEAQARATAGETLVGPEVSRWFPSARVLFPHAATLTRFVSGPSEFIAGERLEPIYLRETTFVKAPPRRVLPSI